MKIHLDITRTTSITLEVNIVQKDILEKLDISPSEFQKNQEEYLEDYLLNYFEGWADSGDEINSTYCLDNFEIV